MILRILLAALSILLGMWLRRRREHFRYFHYLGVPGPEPNLIFGNLLEIYLKNSLWAVNDWHRKFGPVVGLFYGKNPVLLVSDPIILKKVFNDDRNFTNRSPHFNFPGVPNSVACLSGDDWRQLRTLLSKHYTEEGICRFSPEVKNCVDELLKVVKKQSAKGSREFDISAIYDAFALDTICRTTCGLAYDIQSDQRNRLLGFINKMKPPFGLRDLFRTSLPQLNLIFEGVRRKVLALMHGSVRKTSPLQEMHEDCSKRVKMLRSSKKPAGNDLLTVMLAEGYEVTDKQAIDNSVLNVLAGYDTTSGALSFITNMLIRYSEVQDRLRTELQEAFPGGSEVTPQKLKECRYLDAVIRETLRMYAPVYMYTSRTSENPVQIGDLYIQEGLTVMASTREMHYTEELYPEPERFNPDRFLVDDLSQFDDIWIPFGAGPRHCLGKNLAMLAVKFVLAKMVLTYKLDTFEYLPQSRVELQANPGLLKLKTGLRCRASPV
ncbi:cytochrome P450 3A21 [Galendromus occidentalis]|uniref:Cytochrome P450 3A21 n=1 Tax=Galendromus occidentalis TaxID=34638 RepID=A0AAJ6VX16_9ACAR|nr:cytochrome P450 3A21 [Galendromus occidentalis]